MIDVMGHGVGAKAWSIAYAGIARTLLHMLPASSVGTFLFALAKVAWSDPAMEAVIATAIALDLFEDGHIDIVSAGHPLPMIVNGDVARQVNVSGAVLGILEPGGYECVTVELAVGDRLVLSSDGVDVNDASAGGDLPAWLMEECGKSSIFETGSAALRLRAHDELGAQPLDDWTIVVLGRPAALA